MSSAGGLRGHNGAAKRIAVVGGGLAGLAAARALRDDGFAVEVFEAAPRAGGVIVTSRADGFVREHAASSFLASPAGLGGLAAILGIRLVESPPAARRRWIFVGDRLRALPTGPRELVASDLLSTRGKLRLLAEPLSRRAPRDREESVAELLGRRLGQEALRRIGAPFVTGVFAADAAELSAASAFPGLAALDADGGFAIGLLRRRLRGASARPRLVTPVDGMQAIVDALVADLAGAVRLATPVAAIEPTATGVALHLVGAGRHEASACVLAVPAAQAARLVADASAPLAAELDGFRSAPAAVVHLGFPRAAIGHPLDGFGFLVAAGESLRLLGCVFESEIWPGRAPAGAVQLRCILGGARDPAVLDLDDDAMTALCLRDLGRALGGCPSPSHRHVVRWTAGIPQYHLGHAARIGRAERMAGRLGVVLGGTSYHGVGVAPAVADAPRVVAAVRAQLGCAAALAVGLAGACSAGQGGARADGGTAPASRPEAALPTGAPPRAAAGGVGSLEVVVEWLRPPAVLLTSVGTTACGTARRSRLEASGLGGVRGALVRLAGPAAPASHEASALEIDGCRFDRRSLALPAGASIELASRDTRRHDVALIAVSDTAAAGGAPVERHVGEVGLALFGQRRRLAPVEAGLYRFELAAGDAAWVLATPTGRVGVTGDTGVTSFADVAAGRHRLEVVHPPLADGERPLVIRLEVDVVAGKANQQVVDLAVAPRLRPGDGAARGRL